MSMHKGLIGKSEGGGSADVTLGDYITRKQRQAAFDEVTQEKKITFDEWFKHQGFDLALPYEARGLMYIAWRAAQENK